MRRLRRIAVCAVFALSIFAAPASAQLEQRIAANVYWETVITDTNTVVIGFQCHGFTVGLPASTHVNCWIDGRSPGVGRTCPLNTCVWTGGDLSAPNSPYRICWEATANWLMNSPTSTTTTGCTIYGTPPVRYAGSMQNRY